jgi:NADH:ubiquinone reductase (H+-translocating)
MESPRQPARVSGTLPASKTDKRPRVVIIGGGFGGLYAARKLARHPVAITLLDRTNHHTFQPLLYQVATAVLSPGDIASPIRAVLRHRSNVEVILDEVQDFDLVRRVVKTPDNEFPYDYLIVAAGATHSYFGRDDWAPLAPGLKTLEDAIEIRRRVLLAFEWAERAAARGEAPRPINFVIIGGGPTGVELAGALADITRHALAGEFRTIDPARSRVLILEGGPRVLAAYPEDLSRSAQKQLENLGVEVRTSCVVTAVEPGLVRVGETAIESAVTLWAAGVAASPLGKKLGAPTDRAGRVIVEPDLSLPGHPEVFVVGDLASAKQADGRPVPGVAPAAIQMGEATARNVWRAISGEKTQPFHYRDKGSLATIGRDAAVAQIGRLHVGGTIAWLLWLFVHIFFLIGFRNRLLVMIEWAWAYLMHTNPTRLITGRTDMPQGK